MGPMHESNKDWEVECTHVQYIGTVNVREEYWRYTRTYLN